MKTHLLQLLRSNLKQVILAEHVLGVAGIELKHLLDRVEVLDVQGQGLGAEVPDDVLSAWRGGEGALVHVDTVSVQVFSHAGEVHLSSLCVGARLFNVGNMGKDRVEERSGVSQLGEFEEESNNGNGTS